MSFLLLFYGKWLSYLSKKSGYHWCNYRGFTVLKLFIGVGLFINYANGKLLLHKVDANANFVFFTTYCFFKFNISTSISTLVFKTSGKGKVEKKGNLKAIFFLQNKT